MKNIIIDPTLNERLKDGYYFARLYCRNCADTGVGSNTVEVMIPKGQMMPEETFTCPHCECKTLKK